MMTASSDAADMEDSRPNPGETPTLDRNHSGPLAVVGIGASAGGLNAITALLAAVPAGSGLAMVVIQHRTPDNERLLIDLLAKATPLTVESAEDGMAVDADHIYVAPAGKTLTLEHGRFIVGAQPAQGVALPIDIFFRSLAASRQQTAIGVVLSGSGADGSNGLQSIREYGGLVVVQDPATAAFDGMPRSAIATGMADYVLAPDRIPDALVRFVRQPYIRQTASAADPASRGDDLDRVIALMQARCGRDYRAYKTKTLVRRVERRMGIHQIGSMHDYLAFLGTHTGEVEQLSRDILISVTRFFRDPDAFAVLDDSIFGPMIRDRAADRPIRVWVPGCATGEEVYSIAILLKEACAAANSPCDIKVFGTDIDLHALDVARAGVYPETIAVDVSPERLDRFFTRVGTGYKVTKPLREAVSFAAQNMISDPPFSNLDLISCRNVLIYIDPAVQTSILELFHFGLADHGALLLGSAETIGSRNDLFEPLSKKWRLYRKLGAGRRPRMRFPQSTGLPTGPAQTPTAAARTSPAEITRQALLLAYAPAAVLIDRQFRILYLFGPTGDFLDLPTGEPPQDLMAMMRGDLRLKVRGAVEQATASRQRVTVTGVRHKRLGVPSIVTVTAAPVQPPKAADGLLLVTFVAQDAVTGPGPAVASDAAQASVEASAIEQMEYELRVTREDLSGTIRDLEASNEALTSANEEILSMNEELQSSNEEMETSKEELQSLNEELSTVNTQLHEKVDESEAATNDLTNLLTSTDIATLFLSPELRIKRFTAPATRLFSLIPTDIGRPITDVARHFTDPDLLVDIETVLASLSPMEREVEATDGLTLLRRIHPYRTQDNRIEGTVITFSDVTPLKRTAAILALRARQQRSVAELSRKALGGAGQAELLHAALGLVAETLGADCGGIFGASDDGKGLLPLELYGWDRPEGAPPAIPVDPTSHVGQVLWSKQPLIVGDFASDRRVRCGPPLADARVASGLAVAFGGDSRAPAVLAVYSREPGHFGDDDLEFAQAAANVMGLAMERAATLEAARVARDFAQAVVDTVREPLLVLDPALTVTAANQPYHHMFGTTPAATLGRPLHDLVGGIFRDTALIRLLETVVATGTTADALEIDAGRDDDGPRTLRVNVRPLNRSERLILMEMEDITEPLRARQALAAAKAAAEQASAGKTRFLAAASHDLRQPMQAAMLFHHMLSEQDLAEKPAALLHQLGNTLNALRSMLDEILDISRLDAGVVDIQPTDFPLRTLLDHLREEFTPLAEIAGLTLRSVDTRIAVRSDRKLLSRILQNLIANAVKYTEHGRVLVGCRRSGGSVRIQICDTGRGIPEEQLAAIFEEFHQVDNLGRDRSQGLGLGLSIVDRLAKLLGHPIGVRSTLGRGSIFEIVVPVAATAEPAAEPPPEPPLDGTGRHVLVIDDDPAVLDGIRLFLDANGFEVVATVDPALALAMYGERPPPELVIADYRLQGGETGSQAIKRLSASFGRTLPGIILTGDTSPERIREASRSGFTLLHKPINPKDLSAGIRRALANGGDRNRP